MANKRKTITRTFSLKRLIGSRRNRRLQAKQADEPQQPMDWRAMGQRALAAMIFAGQVLGVAAVLSVAGVGGYLAYERLMGSSIFMVQKVRVEGARRADAAHIQRLAAKVAGRHIFSADLRAAHAAVVTHPWVKDARVYRQYPDTVAVEVIEHQAKALLLIGHLYLVDTEGQVFKMASRTEADRLPVITGISRMDYINKPGLAKPLLTAALAALDRYRSMNRPPLSEVNVGPGGEITMYLRRNGVALRFGAEVSPDRLKRLDAVWAALGPETTRVRVVFLDNEMRKDRVTVRMGSF